jgi:hypothetical protein
MIIQGKLPQVLGMEQLNVVIKRDRRAFALNEGTPQELGIDNSQVYLTFVYAKVEVVVWTNVDLEPDQRRKVSHMLLAFVRDRITADGDCNGDGTAANGA